MAVELGAGYISLAVKYAQDLAGDLTKTAETAGEKAGKVLGEKISDNVGKVVKKTDLAPAIAPAAAKAGKDAGKVLADNVKSAVSGKAASIGTDAANQIRDGIKAKGTEVAAAFTGVATHAGERFGNEIGAKIGRSLSDVTKDIPVIGGALSSQFESVGRSIGTSLTGPITKVVSGFAGKIAPIVTGTKLWAAAQWLLNAALSPMGLVIGAIVIAVAALVAGFIYAYKHSDRFRAIVDAAWAAIKAAFQAAWEVIKAVWDGFKEALVVVGEKVTQFWQGVIVPAWEGIKAAFQAAWDFIKDIFDKLRGGFGAVGDFIKTTATSIADGVRSAFSGIANIVKEPIRIIGRLLQKIPEKIGPVSIPGAAGLRSWGETLANLQTGGRVAARSSAGLLSGPGTGTSDSILGVGRGVAVAVSAGEGVVTAHAMQRGGEAIVRALNTWGGVPGMQRGGVIAQMAAFAQGESGKPYQYGGVGDPSWDCSGFMGGLWAIAVGKQPRARHFNTESDFGALGFKPGYQPGAFNIGIQRGGGGPNSHMGGTLPNGTNVESGGTYGVQYGSKAKGANDFPIKYYLPITGDPTGTGQSSFGGFGRGMSAGGGGGGRPMLGRGGGGGFAGAMPGGVPAGGGRAGIPEAVPLIQNPDGTWTSPDPEWAKLIKRESAGRADIIQQIVDANTGGNEAEGLFQIAKGTWAAHGGTEFAPTAGRATPQQQAVVAASIFRKSGGAPWGAGLAGRESNDRLRMGLDNATTSIDGLAGQMEDLSGYMGAGEAVPTTGMAGPAGGGPLDFTDAIGQLADIAKGGVTETLLPPGFSDPMDWPVMKSISGLFGFFSGLTDDPVAKGLLSMGAAGFGGSPSGMVSAIKGITAQGFGKAEAASPALAPDDFIAFAEASGGSMAGALGDLATSFQPEPGAAGPTQIDNSIHIADQGGGVQQAMQESDHRQQVKTRASSGTTMMRELG